MPPSPLLLQTKFYHATVASPPPPPPPPPPPFPPLLCQTYHSTQACNPRLGGGEYSSFAWLLTLPDQISHQASCITEWPQVRKHAQELTNCALHLPYIAL